MEVIQPTIKGRGAAANLPNRFETLHVEPDVDFDTSEIAPPATAYLRDTSRSVISSNDSPDIGFTHSVNPYRGCAHGCIYCYARPTHEYLGFSAGLDFETRIMVKTDAASLLRAELMSPKWVPTPLGFSGVTDCYQPVERKLQITRGCLAVLAEFGNPVTVVTKNHLVTRDIDVLKRLADIHGVHVYLSITTTDAGLTRVMEPQTSVPGRRLAAVETLTEAGIPVGVLMAPIIPGLTETHIPAVVKSATDAGALWIGYTALRLPLAVSPLFQDWLSRHFPDRRDKVLNRIRSLRDGKLNDSTFGDRLRGTGIWADQIRQMFEAAKRVAGFKNRAMPKLSTAAFHRPGGQMRLW